MPSCSECGKEIEKGARFCTSCGHPVSTDSQRSASSSPTNVETRDVTADQRVAVKQSLRWWPICLGAFVSVVLYGIFALITYFAARNVNDTALILILLAVALIGYMIGGLIAGAMAGHRGAVHGILATLIAWVVITIINLARVNFSQVGIFGFVFGGIIDLLILMVIGGLGGALGAWLRNHKSHPGVRSQQ